MRWVVATLIFLAGLSPIRAFGQCNTKQQSDPAAELQATLASARATVSPKGFHPVRVRFKGKLISSNILYQEVDFLATFDLEDGDDYEREIRNLAIAMDLGKGNLDYEHKRVTVVFPPSDRLHGWTTNRRGGAVDIWTEARGGVYSDLSGTVLEGLRPSATLNLAVYCEDEVCRLGLYTAGFHTWGRIDFSPQYHLVADDPDRIVKVEQAP